MIFVAVSIMTNLLLILLLLVGCSEDTPAEPSQEPQDVYGCTDYTACNYNENATDDDGNCYYALDWEDECGVCDLVPSNDCTQDECGIWGGDGVDTDNDGTCDDIDDCIGEFDECGVCNGNGVDADNDDICDDVDECIGHMAECGTRSVFMLLADGIVDENQLNRIGITNNNGILEFNEKKYFPTFYDSETFQGMDEFGHETGLLTLSDLTDGLFNIILKDSNMDKILTISDLVIIDGINIINISLDGTYEILHQAGEFNIQFFVNDSGVEQNNISIFLQYSCVPLDGMGTSTYCNDLILLNRPSTTINFSLCSSSDVHTTISYLDGTIIDESSEFFNAGYYSRSFVPPDEISAGLQVFKYSIIIGEDGCNCGNDNHWFNPICTLSNPYPNPFN